MSLRCRLGYHDWTIENVSITTISGADDPDKYTVCVFKECVCRRCGAKTHKQTWESESCRKFFENHYPKKEKK